MPRGTVDEVARAFVSGGPEMWTHTKGALKGMGFDGESLWSYSWKIGHRTRCGSVVVRPRRESPSMTTTRHISKAVSAAMSLGVTWTEVPFDGWAAARLDPDRIRSVTRVDLTHRAWSVLETWSHDERDFLFVCAVPNDAVGLFSQYAARHGLVGPLREMGSCTWITRERPESAAHLLASVAPDVVWDAIGDGLGVSRIGRDFVVAHSDHPPARFVDELFDRYAPVDSLGNTLPDGIRPEGNMETLISNAWWLTHHLGVLPVQWDKPSLKDNMVELRSWK